MIDSFVKFKKILKICKRTTLKYSYECSFSSDKIVLSKLFYFYSLEGYRHYDPETGRWVTKDPSGLAPGDIYATQLEAGTQAIKDINPTSIKENHEYYGFIYKSGKGYSYTKAKKAPNKDGGKIKCPDRIVPNALYHTHGGGINPGHELYSPADFSAAVSSGMNSYLGTPSGQIQVLLVDGEIGIKILTPGGKKP